MIAPIKNIEDLKHINELISLQIQVKVVGIQDKFDEQNFHKDMKKVFEPVTKSIKDVSEEVTKTMMENSIINNKALENLIKKF